MTYCEFSVTSGGGAASVVNGQVVYDPGQDYQHLAVGEIATVELTYTISDLAGATSTSTVMVTVTGTNDAPVAHADTGATDEDASVTLDVLANDTDVDISDTHTVDSVSVSNGLGSASIADNRVVWVNTKLGESWEDQAGDVVPADPLMERREEWGNDLPDTVAVLTAGVDVQGDRLELQVVGWGRDEESWVVDYRIIWGDPSGPRVWADLDIALQATYVHAKAVPDLPIRAVCIDTGGHHTKASYEFCRTRLARRVWAIKGRGGMGVPVWPRRPTRSNKGKIPLFIVGVDSVKDAVYARLKLTEPGPGFVHFSRDRDAEYFRQLTSERVVTRFLKGRPIRSWQPRREGERNEVLDTFVYAMAGLQGLISMGLRLNDESEVMEAAKIKGDGATPLIKPTPPVIRSAWMK